MFEVTTRLPNSFAFKNNPKQAPQYPTNHKRDPKVSYPFPVQSADSYRPSIRQEMPIYFGQSNSVNNHLGNSNFIASSNPRINNISNPYFYEHNGTSLSYKPPIQRTKENITVLPVYYKSDNQTSNLPSLNRNTNNSPSNNLRSSSYVNKIQINGSQILPPLMNGNQTSSFNETHSSSNFHEQLAAHQRRMNSLDRLNLMNSPQARSNSLNLNRFNSVPSTGSSIANQSVIYSHDATMPTFSNASPTGIDDSKLSVIKSIKARQDMFLSKIGKMSSEEEREENRLKFNFEDTKKPLIQEENELNLLKRNFNYLFSTNNNNSNKNISNNNSNPINTNNTVNTNLNSSTVFKNSENLTKAEINYRNTLLNTDKKLRSIKARQSSLDRLRLEQNDTPISDASSMASSSKVSNGTLTPEAFGGKKSILVKKNKGPTKEKKSVSFAEI